MRRASGPSTLIFELIKCRSFLVSALCASLLGCQSFQSPDVFSLPSNTSDFRNRVYTGGSIGQSRLNPETAGTDYRVESTSAVGAQLKLGYDVHNALAIELDTALLGSSALGEANTGVEFSAATVSALIYGFGGVQMRSRREGLSAFARVGYGVLNKVSIIDNFEFSGAVPVFGLGAEYGFANGVGIRTEITRFDSDVSYVGIGAIFRFGVSSDNVKNDHLPSSAEPVIAQPVDVSPVVQVQAIAVQSPQSLLSNEITPVARADSTVQESSQTNRLGQGSLADRWRPAQRTDDADSDGVLDIADACPATVKFVTVGSDGCGLFDRILHEVNFTKGRRFLNPAARTQLDRVAETLLAFPESRIRITAHTDSKGYAHRNLLLSFRRATVVSEYLRSRGVSQRQLQATGVGETQPIAANSAVADRLKNRRIELLTLPDLDADQLAVDQTVLQPIVKSRSQANSQSIAQPRESVDSIKRDGDHSRTEIEARSANKVQPVMSSEKVVGSPVKSDEEPTLLSAEVVALPVPGYYPGLDIAGIVEGVGFESESDVLTDSGKAALESIATILLDKVTVAIVVMVHTDDLGDELENENLTVQRAEAVVDYLVAAGVERERLQAEGYGELLPLVQNVTEADRARNRRVEIRILPSWPKQLD
ncbi:MAG: outer membrane protein OmpA-like peptidoglycan-associated protein [Porticoccaceae bacterium]|jgi:outer membrane protein OmpA-like peptidoglycan-associated protein